MSAISEHTHASKSNACDRARAVIPPPNFLLVFHEAPSAPNSFALLPVAPTRREMTRRKAQGAPGYCKRREACLSQNGYGMHKKSQLQSIQNGMTLDIKLLLRMLLLPSYANDFMLLFHGLLLAYSIRLPQLSQEGNAAGRASWVDPSPGGS